MHVKCAEADTNTFLSVDWHRWVILFAIHGDGEFGGVRVLFGTDLHCAVVDHDVSSIESSMMVWISIRREDNRATVNLNKLELG